jgi:hypothetical protein
MFGSSPEHDRGAEARLSYTWCQYIVPAQWLWQVRVQFSSWTGQKVYSQAELYLMPVHSPSTVAMAGSCYVHHLNRTEGLQPGWVTPDVGTWSQHSGYGKFVFRSSPEQNPEAEGWLIFTWCQYTVPAQWLYQVRVPFITWTESRECSLVNFRLMSVHSRSAVAISVSYSVNHLNRTDVLQPGWVTLGVSTHSPTSGCGEWKKRCNCHANGVRNCRSASLLWWVIKSIDRFIIEPTKPFRHDLTYLTYRIRTTTNHLEKELFFFYSIEGRTR